MNHKRVYRLYRIEGLILRRKTPRRHVAAIKREIRSVALSRNEYWSMDFISGQIFDEQQVRVLVNVEDFTREYLALDDSNRIHRLDVVKVLERITQLQGVHKRINVDYALESISKDLDR
jgi:putative transposase